MTQAQKRAVQRLRRLAEEDLFFGAPEKHEFKKFEVEELDWGNVSVVIETGLKNDEGTMAAIFARDYCHVFVGPKGGVTWYRHKDGKHTKRYLCEQKTILAAVIDQR